MRKTKFSTPRSSPSRKQSNIHYADLLQKYGSHTNIRPNKQTKNMKINIDSETIDKNLISSIFDTPKPIIEESVIDEQNYKYTIELTSKRSPRLTEDQKTQLFDRLTLPKVITTEIKSPNISPKKKPFSSGKEFNIKFINSRFFDVPEKISLTQFEIILRYFTIIDHSVNDRPLIQEEIVNPCQIDDDFYDSQKLKQILIDSFEKSTGNPFWSEVANCIMSSRLNGKMKMYIRCPTSKSNSSKFKSSASSQVNENKLQNKSIQFSDDMSYTTDEEIDGLQRPVYPNIFKDYYKYYYEPPEEEEQQQNNKFEEDEKIVGQQQNNKLEEEEIVEQQNIKFEEEEEIIEQQQNNKFEEDEKIVGQQQNNKLEEEEIVEQQNIKLEEEEEIIEQQQNNKFEEEEEIIEQQQNNKFEEEEEIIDDELNKDAKEEEDHIEQFENEEKTIEREVKQISSEEERSNNKTSQKEEEEDKTEKEQPVQKKRKNYPNSNQDPFFQNDEYEYNYYSEEQYVKSNLTFDDLIQEAASQPVEEEEFQSIADETSYSKEFLSYDSIDYNSIDNDEDFYVKVKTRRKGSRHRRSTNSLIQDQDNDNDNDKDKNQSKSKSCVPYHHHHRHHNHHHHHKHHNENKEEEEFFDRLKIVQPHKQEEEEEFFDRLKIAQPNKQEDNHVESDSNYKESNSKYSSSEVGKYPVTVPIEDVDANDLKQYEENQ